MSSGNRVFRNRTGGFLEFGLSLGPTVWRMAAAPALGDWMRRFAGILRLGPWEGEPASGAVKDRRTMFLLPEAETPAASLPEDFFLLKESRGLPREGWAEVRFHQMRLWRHPRTPAVILQLKTEGPEESNILAMSEACLPFYIRLIETGGVPLHAALLSRGGESVVLAAPGGTGKSTCARRAPQPWRALSDDMALITRENGTGGGFAAQPFPTWSDYFFTRAEGTWAVEMRQPLRAVFFLSRAEEDRALRMGQGEAAIHLSQSGNQILFVSMRCLPPEDVRRLRAALFDNACRLARSLPVYRLELTLTGAFWREIERVL